jgi:L-rhamnose mutarotase
MSRVRTIEAARKWLESEGVVPLAAHVDGRTSLVEAITGERLKKSWWGHKDGKLIFNLASQLEDEALGVKLFDGKMALVHRRLWPEVLAVVTGAGFREPRIAALSKKARTLFERVERDGPVQGAEKKIADELEDSLLVQVESVHTEKGRHEKRLTAWKEWAKERGVSARPGEPLPHPAFGHLLPKGEGSSST